MSSSASRAAVRASSANTVMNALMAGARCVVCSRQRSRTAETVTCRACSAAARLVIVCDSVGIRIGEGSGRIEFPGGVEVPLSSAERGRCPRERLEQRLQCRQSAALGILRGDIQPGLDGHSKATDYRVQPVTYSRMKRATRIIATIGPAADSDERIAQLVGAGV